MLVVVWTAAMPALPVFGAAGMADRRIGQRVRGVERHGHRRANQPRPQHNHRHQQA
jgi:hypothetical protein